MKLITAFRTLTALSLLILVTACEPKPKENVEVAQDVNDAKLDDRDDEKDADFVVKVIAGHEAEVKLAQLALNRSTHSGVKKAASMLKTNNAKRITELKEYAAKRGFTVPVEETNDAKDEYSDLAKEDKLNDFNEKWCDKLADNHEEAIKYLERRLDKTEDAELKNWIITTLPGLRSQLETLRANELALK